MSMPIEGPNSTPGTTGLRTSPGLLRVLEGIKTFDWRTKARRANSLPVRVFSTMVEQALFAGTNFLLTALMVRWMPIEQFGAYSFAFSFYLLACVVFESFLAEPITIIGAAKYTDEMEAYTGVVLTAHGIGGVVVFFVCLLSSAVLSHAFLSPLLANAMLGLAIAAPLLLLRATTQQLCNSHGFNGIFAIAGIVYAVLAPLFLFLLHELDVLNPASAFTAAAAATAVPCLFLIGTLLYPKESRADVRPLLFRVAREHFDYGRWSSLAQFVQWLGSNFWYLVGPTLIGLDATAAVRGLYNVAMPVFMAQGAILWTFAPKLARYRYSSNEGEYRRLFFLLVACFSALNFAYVTAFLCYGVEAIQMLYHGKFDHVVTIPVVILLAITPFLSALNSVIELHIRVTGGIKRILASKLVWLASTVSIGAGACVLFGFYGVFLGTVISTIFLISANLWLSMARSGSRERDSALDNERPKNE